MMTITNSLGVGSFGKVFGLTDTFHISTWGMEKLFAALLASHPELRGDANYCVAHTLGTFQLLQPKAYVEYVGGQEKSAVSITEPRQIVIDLPLEANGRAQLTLALIGNNKGNLVTFFKEGTKVIPSLMALAIGETPRAEVTGWQQNWSRPVYEYLSSRLDHELQVLDNPIRQLFLTLASDYQYLSSHYREGGTDQLESWRGAIMHSLAMSRPNAGCCRKGGSLRMPAQLPLNKMAKAIFDGDIAEAPSEYDGSHCYDEWNRISDEFAKRMDAIQDACRAHNWG